VKSTTLLLVLLCANTLSAQNNTSFVPGKVWKDDNRNAINAHVTGYFTATLTDRQKIEKKINFDN
jgi:hypothetical protein